MFLAFAACVLAQAQQDEVEAGEELSTIPYTM